MELSYLVFIWKFLVFCTWLTFDLFLRPRSIYRLGIHPYEFWLMSRNDISISRIMYSKMTTKRKISFFLALDGQVSSLRGQNIFANHPRIGLSKRARLAAFDKIRNAFSLTYAQMIAQQLRQLNIYFRHLYFMKTGHELKCCVFILRECITPILCNHRT